MMLDTIRCDYALYELYHYCNNTQQLSSITRNNTNNTTLEDIFINNALVVSCPITLIVPGDDPMIQSHPSPIGTCLNNSKTQTEAEIVTECDWSKYTNKHYSTIELANANHFYFMNNDEHKMILINTLIEICTSV